MIALNQIFMTVAIATGVPPSQIAGGDQTKAVVRARQMVMFLARRHTGMSLTDIARAFGQTDHSTVLYSTKRIEEMLKADAAFAAMIASLSEALEFKARMAAAGVIEVLPLARRIYINPRRAGTGATLHEISAMAAVLIDLWDVAEAAEVLVETHYADISSPEPDTDREAAIGALAGAIRDTMAVLRSDPNTNIQETNNAG